MRAGESTDVSKAVEAVDRKKRDELRKSSVKSIYLFSLIFCHFMSNSTDEQYPFVFVGHRLLLFRLFLQIQRGGKDNITFQQSYAFGEFIL